jgi:hypothetical protein
MNASMLSGRQFAVNSVSSILTTLLDPSLPSLPNFEAVNRCFMGVNATDREDEAGLKHEEPEKTLQCIRRYNFGERTLLDANGGPTTTEPSLRNHI